MNKPTKEEIAKVLDYMNSSSHGDAFLYVCEMAANGVTIRDPESIIQYIEHHDEWIARQNNTTVEELKLWESSVFENDCVNILCCGITKRGTPCKSVIKKCNGFQEWVEFRSLKSYCKQHCSK
jgi:hypothetical protein